MLFSTEAVPWLGRSSQEPQPSQHHGTHLPEKLISSFNAVKHRNLDFCRHLDQLASRGHTEPSLHISTQRQGVHTAPPCFSVQRLGVAPKAPICYFTGPAGCLNLQVQKSRVCSQKPWASPTYLMMGILHPPDPQASANWSSARTWSCRHRRELASAPSKSWSAP